MVYHLQVQANSTKYGELVEKNNFFTEVYASLEKALEQGKDWLNKRISYIYKKSCYFIGEKTNLNIKEMFDDNEFFYSFKIVEVDPEYADNFEIPDYEYKCKNLKPTHIICYYNLEGNLLYKDLEYRSNKSDFAYIITRYPGDDENKKNKFNIGDFVTVVDDECIPPNQPCVIYAVPKRNDLKVYFENTYCLSTISNGCVFEFYHEHNESRLRKYEGKIKKDSPLILLQKIYRNEIKLSKEILRKIENNEIILNTKPTIKDCVEF